MAWVTVSASHGATMTPQQTVAFQELVGAVTDAFHTAEGEWMRSKYHPSCRHAKDVRYYAEVLEHARDAFGAEVVP